MRALTTSRSKLTHSLHLTTACAALLAGALLSTGCQSGPDDELGNDSVDVEVDAIGDAAADDVDQDPNIGEPMN